MKLIYKVVLCSLLVSGLMMGAVACGGGGGSGGSSYSLVGSWQVVDTTASKSYIGNVYTARADGTITIFYFNLGYRVDGTYSASGNVVEINIANDLIVHYTLVWTDANNVQIHGNGVVETLVRM